MKTTITIAIANKIRIYHNTVHPDVLNQLTHVLRFKDPEYGKKLAFAKTKKSRLAIRQWGGWIPLYIWDNTGFYFGIGLWHLADPIISAYYDVVWQDQRTFNPADFSDYGLGFTPRGYQQACLEKSKIWNHGLFGLPTATGKTKLAQLIIRDKSQRTLYVVPSAELMYESRKDFADCYGIDEKRIGLIGDGKCQIEDITVGIYKSLSKESLKDYLHSVGLIWVDEAHRSPAKTFEAIVENCPAFYKYAGTATLFRADKMESKMFASFGYVLFQMSVTEAIQEKYIARPIIRLIRGGYRTYMGDYQGVMKEMVEDRERAKKVFRYAAAGEKPTIIFVDRKESKRRVTRREASVATSKITKKEIKNKRTGVVEEEILYQTFDSHARIMYQVGKEMGLSIELVTGDDTSAKRKQVLKDLRNGSVKVVVATNVWDEGIDVTNIHRVVFASPFKSPVKVYQRIGRGLRMEDGKDFLEVLIFVDEDEKQYFKKQVREQIKTISKEPEFWSTFEQGISLHGMRPNGDQDEIMNMLKAENCHTE